MEALEFLKASERMCEANHCVDCPAKNKCLYVNHHSEDKLEEIVSAVEQWNREHPIVTNAQKFEEVFGLSGYRLITQSADWWDEPYKENKE